MGASTSLPAGELPHALRVTEPGRAPVTRAAHQLAHMGYAVFPVTAASKVPATPHGFKDATADPARITTLFRSDHNLAVLPPAHVLVLDCDSAHAAAELEARHPELQAAPKAVTPRGGAHYWLRLPEDEAPLATRTRALPDVDIRGLGKAYVLASPSRTPAGAYRWERELLPAPELPVASARLLATLRPARPPSPPVTAVRNLGRYAQAVLEYEAARVASAPEGARNNTLNVAAFNLGQLATAGEFDEATVTTRLVAAADACGLSRDEALPTIDSGFRAGREHPRSLRPGPLAAAGASPPPPLGEVPGLLRYPRSNAGDAERLVALHGHEIRYVEGLGFLAWDGKRWIRDSELLRLTQYAIHTTRTLQQQALQLQDPRDREAWGKWALTGEHRSRLTNCIGLAATYPQIQVTAGQLDADPDLLNVANGTLNLRSGQLKPHDPRDLITKLAPVTFDPAATCSTWDAFQKRIAGGDLELVRYKRRAFGYSLTGHTSEDALFIAHGGGANGKSTELTTLQALAGDYGAVAQFASFAVKRGDGIPNDIAALRGARLVSASEGDSQQRLAEGLVKQLTGGDAVTARFLHQEYFTFTPAFKAWLATNHKPSIRGTDDGIWRRIRLVPYGITIPPEERDPRLREKLQAELPGILNRILEGARAWYQHGLGSTPAVDGATRSYRRDSDALLGFLEAHCDTSDAAATTASKALHEAYTRWCDDSGEEPVSAAVFGRMLTERGYSSGQARLNGKPTKIRQGLRLLHP